MKNLLYIFVLVCCISFAQQTPGLKQSEAITIIGATAHIGNGKVIDNSLLILENGKLSLVADATLTKVPYKGKVIDATGKHIYPGFIAPNATLGLVEVDAVRASNDHREIGVYNPHIRSIIAYNTESRVTETLRPNGVLQAQIVPRGGRISGTSSIVQLDAWNYEDALIKENDGIHINWPRTFNRSGWWAEPGPTTPNKKYQEQINNLENFFTKAAHYDSKNGVDLKLESMLGTLDGSKKIFIHLEDEKQIIDAIHFGLKHKLNIVLVGAYDAHKTTNLLKKHNIPVLLQRVHSTPSNDDDDYDLPYKLASKLVDAGILVGLETSGDMERMNSRNLPFYAGTCVGYGLDKEIAISLISLNTAKILGIDSFTGSLETGKDATLFISEGDALDMRTNKLTHAFIQGRKISLESHQTELYQRYRNKK
ncbi:amidohydrolase [Pseudofulvibacter geojedonensis]|uniref:Amidohydrolase n=1 Tax=Pseudofulvibacter geojedonensis TaxID=1123758 RepID=A0ABW3I2Y2_9FLAO